MLKDRVYTLLFLFLGLGFITVGYLLSQPPKTSSQTRHLARIDKLSGTVSIQRKDKSRSELMGDSDRLSELDSIETYRDSTAEIAFDDGTKIRLNAESKILLDKEKQNVIVLLNKGTLNFENYGSSESLFISFQGLRIKAKEWETWLAQHLSGNSKTKNPLNTFPSSEQLSETYIAGTIQSHKSKFLQCYNKLLQRTPGQTGSVTLAFTIEKTGRVSNPNVASSALQDATFRSCLFEVLNRIEFKAFEGEPVSTVIPLNFE